MALQQEKVYTVEDIYALPDGERAELIDGRIYYRTPPSRVHQRLVYQLGRRIGNYIDAKGGDCEVYPAPFAVFLNEDQKNYVEPDISVICDKNKLDDRGCNGTPDWVIEILSSSTERMDCGVKLFKYRTAGVREYWIVNPRLRTVNVYDFEKNEKTGQYGFADVISSCVYGDLEICVGELV